jgi:hypothetical protein
MSRGSRTSNGWRATAAPADDSKLIRAARAELTAPSELRFFDKHVEESTDWSVGELDMLVLAARQAALVEAAHKAIRKHGILVRGQKQNLVRNPAFAVERAASIELRSLLKLLKQSEAR